MNPWPLNPMPVGLPASTYSNKPRLDLHLQYRLNRQCMVIKVLFPLPLTGECWSSKMGHLTYDVNGLSKAGCIDQCYEPCKKHSKFCSGKNFANCVYKLSKRLPNGIVGATLCVKFTDWFIRYLIKSFFLHNLSIDPHWPPIFCLLALINPIFIYLTSSFFWGLVVHVLMVHMMGTAWSHPTYRSYTIMLDSVAS